MGTTQIAQEEDKMKKPTLFLYLLATGLLILFGSRSAFAAASINVSGSLTHEKVAAIGANYNGSILIENTGKVTCAVRIYQTDYLYYANGSNIYGIPGEIPSSNAKWITLGANWITIPANEEGVVNYQVQVPNNSRLRGTYWSMIMVEVADDQPLVRNKGQGAVALQTKLRYGVQIITHIGNTGTRQIKFLDRKIINDGGQRFLQLDIENSGERALLPSVSLQLFDKGGRLIGNFYGKKARIFPTCSIRQRINLPSIPKGNYKALVIVDNEDQYVFGANYDLAIEK